MNRLFTALSLTAGITLLAASSVQAQQAKDWLVCGGNSSTFDTCASVFLTVGAPDSEGRQSVTMKVWNLSGANDSYAGGIFTKIGFFHQDFTKDPGGIEAYAEGPITMTGPSVGNATAWEIGSPNKAGGVYLDISTHNGDGVNNGIASGCDPSLIPANADAVWVNPCYDEGFEHDPDANPDSWITLSFDVVGTWDLATTEMLVFVQNGEGAEDSLQCITGGGKLNCEPVRVPEPTTWLLLATGLGGLGLIRIRRRRESPYDVTA